MSSKKNAGDAARGGHWTIRDKVRLLRALHRHGDDVDAVIRCLPDKRPEAVRRRVEYYRGLASKRRRPKRLRDVEGALTRWAEAVPPVSPGGTALAESLRLIAALEPRAPPEETGGVDLTALYHYLAHLVHLPHLPAPAAVPPVAVVPAVPKLNLRTVRFLSACVADLFAQKRTPHHQQETEFLHDVRRIYPDISTPTIHDRTPMAEELRVILSSPACNPLDYPFRFLENNSGSQDNL